MSFGKALLQLIKLPFRFLGIPFKMIPFLFKLKLRHTIAILFIVTLLFSSIGESIKEKNPSIFVVNLARAFIGADENISHTIEQLANAEKITILSHAWLIFNTLGSLYFIFYLFYFFTKAYSALVSSPSSWTYLGLFIIYFFILFTAKMFFFVIESELTDQEFKLSEGKNWLKSIPFKFVYDFAINFDKLYSNLQPIVDQTQDFTQPFNQTDGA